MNRKGKWHPDVNLFCFLHMIISNTYMTMTYTTFIEYSSKAYCALEDFWTLTESEEHADAADAPGSMLVAPKPAFFWPWRVWQLL